MLGVESDQVQRKFSTFLSFGIFESQAKNRRVLVGLKGNRIAGVGQLEHLSEVEDVDAQDHVGVAAVGLEALHAQTQRD